MPGTTLPFAPHYVAPPITTENLDYADLSVIDLAKCETEEGRALVADQVVNAMQKDGFFYVINHGYELSQTERIFDIADIPFAGVSDVEKQAYTGTMKESGSYQGYKPRQYWHVGNGVRDQVEAYNINRDVTLRKHPQAVTPFLPEIEAFARHNHFNVLHPILRLMAIGLELPEDAFENLHGYTSVGETYVRFMKYYPRSELEEEQSKNVWLKGHTDFGTITILWSQPVSGLQILSPDGSWKWVKHIENALVINAGDAMEFLSGGFYKATIHRVIQPPNDQQTVSRLGVFYFCMSDDDVKLIPMSNSQVLKRVGIKKRFEDDKAPTMKEWRQGRTAAYGQSALIPGQEKGTEVEMINGILVKHYN